MLYETIPYDPDRHQIFSLHIRKTGGTSLYLALLPAFRLPEGTRVKGLRNTTIWTDESGLLGLHGRLRRAVMRAGKALVDAAQAALGRRLIPETELPVSGGHVTFDTIPRGRRELLLVTIVRDPLARFLSDYRFMRAKRDRSRADCLEAGLYDLPLPEFAARILADPALFRWNTQCMQLAGRPEFEPARRVLDEAFWLAGTTERLQELLDLIGHATGRDIGRIPHFRNTGAGKAARLPDDLALGLCEKLAEDAKLHAWVGAEFARIHGAALGPQAGSAITS
ncbi:MAG TPA: hypothetical protein VFR34_09635 [Paracoccaceae bacterium]|nr:hypothetical protein [Paracoccaceae bacterium]